AGAFSASGPDGHIAHPTAPPTAVIRVRRLVGWAMLPIMAAVQASPRTAAQKHFWLPGSASVRDGHIAPRPVQTASRSMIQAKSGWAAKRHLRSGPAMTFR